MDKKTLAQTASIGGVTFLSAIQEQEAPGYEDFGDHEKEVQRQKRLLAEHQRQYD